MSFKYFDCHSHVTFKDYDADLDDVLARMQEHEVGTITVGVDQATSEEAVAFADEHEGFYATIGLHPTDTTTETFTDAPYRKLVTHPKVVGIGECGLDYYRLAGDADTEKKRQRLEFEKQIVFAIDSLKPLMIHARPSKGSMDAYEDVLGMLEPLKGTITGNVHFFVGNVDIARRFYDLNFSTSFTGVVTFAREYDDVIRFASIDMILTETDSPFASPVPFRGKRNEPSYVRHVVKALSEILNLPEEPLREQIVENAVRVFQLGTMN